jgi:hypothetical protein
MLKNPVYVGQIRTTEGVYPGRFKPLVSRKTSNQVLSVLLGNATGGGPRILNNPKFPLRRFIVCSECGKSLTGSASRGRSGKKYAYYYHHNRECDRTKSVPAGRLESLYVAYLKALSPSEGFEAMFKAVIRDLWRDRTQDARKQNAAVKKALDGLVAERQKVFDLHRSGIYSDQDFRDQKNLIEKRISDENAKFSIEESSDADLYGATDVCFEYLHRLPGAWKRASSPTKQKIQKLVFEEKVPFDGRALGTAKTSLILELNKTFRGGRSHLVVPRGFEPSP